MDSYVLALTHPAKACASVGGVTAIEFGSLKIYGI